MSEKKTIVELVAELEKAKAVLGSAEQRESIARTEVSEARNRLNQIQKAIDAWYQNEVNAASWNTDWASKKEMVRLK